MREPNFVAEAFEHPVFGDLVARAWYADLHGFLAENILRGSDRTSMSHGLEVRAPFTDHVLIEDEVAQTGQGAVANRSREHLGRSDTGVLFLRKLWERELRALADGRPVKQWVYRPEMVPVYPGG